MYAGQSPKLFFLRSSFQLRITKVLEFVFPVALLPEVTCLPYRNLIEVTSSGSLIPGVTRLSTHLQKFWQSNS